MSLIDKIKASVDWLNQRTVEYEAGNPTVSDEEWDNEYFKLKWLESESGIVLLDSPTQKIKYEIVTNLNKVEHNHKMLSLDKTKDWNEFLQYFSGKDVVGMLKLDGLTCSLRYVNGELVSAETRGNGLIGEDILHNAKVIASIPKKIDYKDELIVDGEVICTEAAFKQFENEYANPRNFASGSIRLLNSRECAERNLTFIVWNVVKGFPEEKKLLDKFYKAENLGFIIVPWTSSFDWDAKEFLVNQATMLGYPIDGLVGRFDDIAYGESLGETGHHAKAAYAFKFYDETYETELLDLTYEVSRNGEMVPVALFEPVETEESVISRASLHNLSIVEKMLGVPRRGQKILVAKQNAIIPQITWGDKESLTGEIIEYPHTCPFCNEEVTIITSDSGVKSLFCSNENCNCRLINRLENFVGKKGMDIKGLSKATLSKLLDWGWINSIQDLYSLNQYRTEWINKTGFGVKSVDNILSAIENSKNCELSAFLTALGIPLVGAIYAKKLAETEENWFEFFNDVQSNCDFSIIDGFGPEITSAINSFDFTEANGLATSILNISNSYYHKHAAGIKLQGMTFVITGKLNSFKNREELQNKIEELGGKISNSVTKNTNYLINNDNASNSSKNLTAKRLQVPIITEEELIKNFF